MSPTPLKIACFGEAMIEISANALPGTGQLSVAGDSLNTAVYLRRALSKRHDVAYVTALGRDALSDQMEAFMQSEGLNTDFIMRSPDRGPGLYAIHTDAQGERSFQYWRENSAARQLFQTETGARFDILASFDVVAASAISLAILPHPVRMAFMDWLRSYRSKGGVFAFDSNYRPTLWENQQTARDVVEQAWQICDIALPSLDDEIALFGDADQEAVLRRFATYPSCIGALKRGAEGPVPINAQLDRPLTFQPCTNVVDTTAAGDSFSGAFLACYLSGVGLAEAMMQGHNCAAEVIAHRGAIIPRT